jgi:hypothetical protein
MPIFGYPAGASGVWASKRRSEHQRLCAYRGARACFPSEFKIREKCENAYELPRFQALAVDSDESAGEAGGRVG